MGQIWQNRRADFPIFQNRPSFAYLDTAATAQLPSAVLDAMIDFEVQTRSNVHRGVYQEAEMATSAYENARQNVAGFIGANNDEVVFTSGATAGMNMLAQMVSEFLSAGDGILVSSMEHHSALLPWRRVAEEKGVMVTTVPHTAEYRFDLETYRLMLNDRVRVVVVTAASNVLGTVNPIAEIVRLAHACGALVVVDAAQYVPHLSLNVHEWGADAVVFSGHKMYGPMGIGVLYLAAGLAASLTPAFVGGGMVREVTRAGLAYEDAPWKFEAGTPNVMGAIGLGAAARYLSMLGMEAVAERETVLTRELIVGLLSLGDIQIVGPDSMDSRVGVVSFNVPQMHPHDMASLLSEQGVAVRAGHHCAMPLVSMISESGVVRASLGIYNDEEDIARLIDGIRDARAKFGYV